MRNRSLPPPAVFFWGAGRSCDDRWQATTEQCLGGPSCGSTISVAGPREVDGSPVFFLRRSSHFLSAFLFLFWASLCVHVLIFGDNYSPRSSRRRKLIRGHTTAQGIGRLFKKRGEPAHLSVPYCLLNATRELGGADVFRALPLRALADGVGYSLAFSQFVESDSVEIRHVEENVSTISSANETKSLVCHFLDCAFGHRSHLFKIKFRNFARTTCPSQLTITARV